MGRGHSTLRQKIRAALEGQGALVISQPASDTTGPGVSDMLACWPGGLFVAVEVKDFGDDMSDLQSLFQDEVRKRGGIALEGRSTDQVLSDIRRLLKEKADGSNSAPTQTQEG